MISIYFGLLYVAMLVWMAWKRRYLIFVLMIILLALSLRLLSAIYLDVTGPTYSINLFREVGGYNSAIPLVIAHLLAFSIIATVLGGQRLQRLATKKFGGIKPDPAAFVRTSGNVALAVFSVFVLLLYFDMAQRGVVPLIHQVERWVYTEMAGPAHQVLTKYGIHIGFYCGLFFSWRVLLRGSPDYRFLLVLLSIFIYLFLAGHRVSAFYTSGSGFLIPYGLIVLRQQFGSPAVVAAPSRLDRFMRKAIGVGAVLVVISLIFYALYASFVITRDFGLEGAQIAVKHRIMVQFGELWAGMYERVFVAGQFNPEAAVAGVWTDPVVTGRNTTIPYLMVVEIGDLAYPMLELGLNYGGGYPEIFFELLGKWGAYIPIALNALIMSSFIALIYHAMLEARFIRLFLLFYVAFPFILVYHGGMLNFLGWKYAVKVCALIGWLVFESQTETVPDTTDPGGEDQLVLRPA